MGAPPISLMGDELLAALKGSRPDGYVGRHIRSDER
jgi:hypothetical protein